MLDFLNPGKREKEEIRAEQRSVIAQKDLSTHQSLVGDDQMHYYEQDRRSDLLKWQQELDDVLTNIRFKLKGYIRSEGGWKKQENMKPLANDEFINEIETQIEPFMNRNLINSNITEERAYMMLRYTMHDIVDLMSDGWDKYKIKFTNFDAITRIIQNSILPAPFRAVKGWTKKTDSTVNKRVENFTEQPMREQKKFMGMI